MLIGSSAFTRKDSLGIIINILVILIDQIVVMLYKNRCLFNNEKRLTL